MNETINGIGSIHGGEYDEIHVDGMGKLKGKVKARLIKVDGTFKGKGRISADELFIDGLARIFRPLRVKKVTVDGLLKLRRARLEADEIFCDGIIVSNREISADSIMIDGTCSVSRMVGDSVIVKNKSNGLMESKIPAKIRPFLRFYCGRKVDFEYSLIDEIECTKLEAEKIKAKHVHAHDVKLGGNCVIDELNCDGSMEVDPSCIIGRYTGKDGINSDSTDNRKRAGNMADRTLEKVLEMYKQGSINADEAEQLLKTSDIFAKQPVAPSAESSVNWEDDDKVRIVVFRGRRLLKKEEAGSLSITAELQGDVADVECWGNLQCGNVRGSVHVGNTLTCGDISGDVRCGNEIYCSNVGGSVRSGGGVHEANNIFG